MFKALGLVEQLDHPIRTFKKQAWCKFMLEFTLKDWAQDATILDRNNTLLDVPRHVELCRKNIIKLSTTKTLLT